MAGIRMFEEQLRLTAPHTLNALQKLVMAMADVTNSAGKKTLFGRDKGKEAYAEFLRVLKVTVQSMVLDGLIRESTPAEEVATKLEEILSKFAIAFPNWKDAYGYAAFFLHDERKAAVATIDRLRLVP